LSHSLSSLMSFSLSFSLFFFTDPATTEIYTLSLHDALPIFGSRCAACLSPGARSRRPPSPRSARRESSPNAGRSPRGRPARRTRSEEHTSELQSLAYLVCRLLLEKKKKNTQNKIKSQRYKID